MTAEEDAALLSHVWHGLLHQVNVDWYNLKTQVCTGCIWLILGSRNLSWSPWVLWSDEERMNMLDGCHHVYLDMGTNTGVQIRFNILGIDSRVCTNKGSSRYGCIGYPFLSDDMKWSSYSQKRQEIYLTNWQHRRAAKICNGVKENHNLVFSSGNSMSHIYFPMHQFWRSSRDTLVILNTGIFFFIYELIAICKSLQKMKKKNWKLVVAFFSWVPKVCFRDYMQESEFNRSWIFL